MQGRIMDYDTLGRLIRVRDKDQELLCDYRYDAAGKLVAQIAPGQPDTYLFYSEEALIATKTGESRTSSLSDGKTFWGQIVQNTESAQQPEQNPSPILYTLRSKHQATDTAYIIRSYNASTPPTPFASGEHNPYNYCLSDPVNRVDPSGHRSVLGIYFGWKTLIESILGVLASILAVIFTAGAGLAVEVAVGTVVGGVSSAAGGALGDLAEGQTPSWSSVGENFGMGLATSLAGPLVNRAFGAAKAL
ncbi:uncharacterized protein ATNIH1004_005507 [Aspergillus tanneri]|uniref:RHS repeat-associated core domain-containing protein n=1 Tax=Aspergillus tanneri TaxID=1220188 RepID=A0A5M9MIJ7_9EURO|nr:uncharacterized protein ATNIH1004_005507 [Aspergillus tanneri]KAA8646832.1 hypothetical protein ATNIH1004_005507 [Aspergillus tanneri]